MKGLIQAPDTGWCTPTADSLAAVAWTYDPDAETARLARAPTDGGVADSSAMTFFKAFPWETPNAEPDPERTQLTSALGRP